MSASSKLSAPPGAGAASPPAAAAGAAPPPPFFFPFFPFLFFLLKALTNSARVWRTRSIVWMTMALSASNDMACASRLRRSMMIFSSSDFLAMLASTRSKCSSSVMNSSRSFAMRRSMSSISRSRSLMSPSYASMTALRSRSFRAIKRRWVFSSSRCSSDDSARRPLSALSLSSSALRVVACSFVLFSMCSLTSFSMPASVERFDWLRSCFSALSLLSVWSNTETSRSRSTLRRSSACWSRSRWRSARCTFSSRSCSSSRFVVSSSMVVLRCRKVTPLSCDSWLMNSSVGGAPASRWKMTSAATGWLRTLRQNSRTQCATRSACAASVSGPPRFPYPASASSSAVSAAAECAAPSSSSAGNSPFVLFPYGSCGK
mmetsp:Transcript_36489/g.114383  ORF Transcript_36489/g.114383 Transcript_36489/m.114383 type:complete len:374 (+) Transcript_36489:1528-2649(+)